MLSDTQITHFQALYKTRFGIDIAKDEAREKGEKLICLIRSIYKPMTPENYQTLEDIRKTEKP